MYDNFITMDNPESKPNQIEVVMAKTKQYYET